MTSGTPARASIDARLLHQMAASIWSLRVVIMLSTPVLAVNLALRGHPKAGAIWFVVALPATVAGLWLVRTIGRAADPLPLDLPMAAFTGVTTTMWSVPALFFGTSSTASALFTFLPMVVILGSTSVLFAARLRTCATAAVPVTAVYFWCAARSGGIVALATLPGFAISLAVFGMQAWWSNRTMRATMAAHDEAQELASSLHAERQAALAASEAMRQLAERDPLTGAYNRRYLTTYVERLDTAGRREQHHLAMIDLDHFKRTNDELGHAAGDLVLQELVRCTLSALPQGSIVARWGGEEFVALVPGTTSEAVAALAHLRAEFAERAPSGGSSFSAGLVTWPPSLGFDAALRVADGALYQAKRDGRDRVIVLAGGSSRTIGGEDAVVA